MLYISWNVNGIRSALGKGFSDFMAQYMPDVLCLQEVRALPEQVQLDYPGYRAYWHPAERKGYSGVTTLTRVEPLDVRLDIGDKDFAGEGRALTLEFADHFLINIYTPNSQRELTRLPYRRRWDAALLKYLKTLEADKPVIFCGDLNVSHKPIDLANPKSNQNNAGFTPEERAGFQAFVQAGFLDTFREFESGGGHYSWWSYRANARSRNIGWRLDYFLISDVLRPRLKVAQIHPDVAGSDHCPVSLEIF